MIRLAIIGDFDRGVTAHEGIDASLSRAQQMQWSELSWEWWHTSVLPDRPDEMPEVIGRPDGVWCAPASPYAHMDAALAAIRYARESETPFLGTCGGFQHLVLEFVRNVVGETEAQHAELQPQAALLAITSLACELVEVRGMIEWVRGTRLGDLYAAESSWREEYNCRFGVNPDIVRLLESKGLRCVARDEEGEVRAMEYVPHPFFVGTLFQPERRVLRSGVAAAASGAAGPPIGGSTAGVGGVAEGGEVHPLVLQFIEAASQRRERRIKGAL